MQTFLLILIFILIVINLKQADELRDLERKTLDDLQCRAASSRKSGASEQEEITSNARDARDRTGQIAVRGFAGQFAVRDRTGQVANEAQMKK